MTTALDSYSKQGAQVSTYLAALLGDARPGAFLELRHRHSTGRIRQLFFPASGIVAAACAVARLGRRGDVYTGVALRSERAGTRDAIAYGWTLWADCDGAACVDALTGFDPAPALVVRSGSGTNCHAYWPLAAALSPGRLEDANRRLAHALGADHSATDAARILRPPGTLSFKHDPPAPVTLVRSTGERFEWRCVLASAPEVPVRPAPRPAPEVWHEDPLRAIPPAEYVTALTGTEPGPDGKIRCPFHADRTPSLHVYETAAEGWFCFGCRRGGSIYDFAAPLLGLRTAGYDFTVLRRRLQPLLLRSSRRSNSRSRRPAGAATVSGWPGSSCPDS